METGKFYFLKNTYYSDFNDCNLMGNKEKTNNINHNRPCFYCFEMNGFYWMIPISSQVQKYEEIYKEKMKRYNGKFDGIRFGYVNGKKRAFLLQNICPVTDKYIDSKYQINKNTIDVTINPKFQNELEKTARKILNLYKKGIKITLTDLDKIIQSL